MGSTRTIRVNWLDEDGDTLVPSEEKNHGLPTAVGRGNDSLSIEPVCFSTQAQTSATTNSSGDSLYLIARKAGNKDFAEELASLGSERQELPEVEEFIALCMNADIAGARQMIEKNSNLVAQAEQDFADTAGIAAGEGNLEGLKTLQELGFNLGKMQGQTPMHRAVLSGHIEVLTWLVEQGCDLGVRDDVHGSTPLQWSEALGRQQCREYLCQFDLDLFDSILARNIERIEILVAKDFSALEKTLKEVRASDYEFSDDWCTPLAFAVLRGKVSAVRCLLQVGAGRSSTQSEWQDSQRTCERARLEGSQRSVVKPLCGGREDYDRCVDGNVDIGFQRLAVGVQSNIVVDRISRKVVQVLHQLFSNLFRIVRENLC